jgi:hypothetical protein
MNSWLRFELATFPALDPEDECGDPRVPIHI